MDIYNRKGIGAFGAFLALILLVFAFTAGPVIGAGQDPRAKKFTPFTITTFKGTPLNLADYNGSPIVLNFWGSWCFPCIEEADDLVRIHHEYKDKGVKFVGIAVQDMLGAAVEFVEEHKIDFPNALDEGDALMQKFDIYVVPMTLVVDRNGYIVYRRFGVVDPSRLRSMLDRVL